MGRTRQAALDGARRVLAEHGLRKATMGDVAVRGGLAKATLYNHFRTKDDLVSGLIADDVAELGADCRDLAASDLVVALTRAADAVAGNPVLAGLRAVEPAALLGASAPGAGARWDLVRTQVALVLDVAERSTSDVDIDLVTRWLASHVVEPGTQLSRSAQARLLASAVPAAVRTTSFATPSA
jgi:AcrR family transcriptional regulator